MTFHPAIAAAGAAARILTGIILAAGVAGAAAAAPQDWTSPRKGDAATRAWERTKAEPGDRPKAQKASAPKQVHSEEESNRIGAEARRQAEARQRGWDAKMKAVSGSICRGC
jgi:hypothetical protein